MNDNHVALIARDHKLGEDRVRAAAWLIDQGSTVPFIARYRKEATGSLDEVAITAIRDGMEKLAELDKRRDAILKSLSERELLTDELAGKVGSAATMVALEDFYLPFRPKRRTRATMAREKGLETLARMLWTQESGQPIDPSAEAEGFLNVEKGVATPEDALTGARHIMAEMVSEDETARSRLRDLFLRRATIRSRVVKGKEQDGAKYRDYFEWEEAAAQSPSHRVLAMRRGEKERYLTLRVAPPEDEAVGLLRRLFVKNETPAAGQVALAVEDGYRRLLGPSMEAEIRAEMKSRADGEAIRVFASNLRELLLAPALGQKSVLALDPGFRTGCKLVCLDRQGRLVHNETVFPHTSQRQSEAAGKTVQRLCEEHDVEAVAVGNGTAGRETEAFVRKLGLPSGIPIVLVNESGASIYSASETAREEFPDHDVTVRGAVSIGRRLMDPLAELVKIDPRSIGVGQYQHDVDQKALKRSLDDEVMSCVNAVGVDLNTASKQLLIYVSGLGPQLAGSIVAFRDENGPFAARSGLKKVPRLGPKAFEQAAGFLRIRGGGNPLDASAVHPESYSIVKSMAKDLGCSIEDLMRRDDLRKRIEPEKWVTEKAGLPTLRDIISELARPGRDPRETFEIFSFAEGIEKIDDVAAGMKVPGVVTNVTAFGAFVDIGVHQDGLVHISQLADRFVRDPAEVVKVGQKVQVFVLDVDLDRSRIALSMKSDPRPR